MLATHRRETGMSKSDLAQVRTVFERYDRDSDGTIDEVEFTAAASSPAGQLGVNPLAQLDKNSDGRLTMNEVQQIMIDNRKTLGFNDDQLAEAKKLMTRHDKDRNGFIEQSELYETPVSGQLSEAILRRADQDDDQRISQLELARYLAVQAKDGK